MREYAAGKGSGVGSCCIKRINAWAIFRQVWRCKWQPELGLRREEAGIVGRKKLRKYAGVGEW